MKTPVLPMMISNRAAPRTREHVPEQLQPAITRSTRLALCRSIAILIALPSIGLAQSGGPGAIEQIKPSIVAVGTFQRTRNPQFRFLGTGFAVGNGSFVATNAHVLPKILDGEQNESVVIALPSSAGAKVQVRMARKVGSETSADLALLKIDGSPLRPLRLGNSALVHEGETYFFTGFPIGEAIGLVAATHRAMVSAVTPIAIPQARANQLEARALRQLAEGAYPIFQLDATAYPGNSGSPLYHPETAEVVGIINMVFVKGSKETALTEPSGISYAIPIQHLKDLLERSR
jgi:S1-C subfamily serine protease